MKFPNKNYALCALAVGVLIFLFYTVERMARNSSQGNGRAGAESPLGGWSNESGTQASERKVIQARLAKKDFSRFEDQDDFSQDYADHLAILPIDTTTFKLSSLYVEHLKLNEEEVSEIEQCLKRLLDDLIAAEADAAVTLANDENGIEVEIQAYPNEGEQAKREFIRGVSDVIGDKQAGFFLLLAKGMFDAEFGSFGLKRQRLSVKDERGGARFSAKTYNSIESLPKALREGHTDQMLLSSVYNQWDKDVPIRYRHLIKVDEGEDNRE